MSTLMAFDRRPVSVARDRPFPVEVRDHAHVPLVHFAVQHQVAGIARSVDNGGHRGDGHELARRVVQVPWIRYQARCAYWAITPSSAVSKL